VENESIHKPHIILDFLGTGKQFCHFCYPDNPYLDDPYIAAFYKRTPCVKTTLVKMSVQQQDNNSLYLIPIKHCI